MTSKSSLEDLSAITEGLFKIRRESEEFCFQVLDFIETFPGHRTRKRLFREIGIRRSVASLSQTNKDLEKRMKKLGIEDPLE